MHRWPFPHQGFNFNCDGSELSPWVNPPCPWSCHSPVPLLCVRSLLRVLPGWNQPVLEGNSWICAAHLETTAAGALVQSLCVWAWGRAGKVNSYYFLSQSVRGEILVRLEQKPPGQSTAKGGNCSSGRAGEVLPVCSGQSERGCFVSRMWGLDVQSHTEECAERI